MFTYHHLIYINLGKVKVSIVNNDNRFDKEMNKKQCVEDNRIQPYNYVHAEPILHNLHRRIITQKGSNNLILIR